MKKEDFPCFCEHKNYKHTFFVLDEKGNFYDYSKGQLKLDRYSSGIKNLNKIEDKIKLNELMKKEINYLFLGEEDEA